MNIRSFLGKAYYPLNTIEISERALVNNYFYLSNLSKGIQVAPVLKSNAYGHGLIPVAKILSRVKPPFFCVDSLYEAYEIYKNNIKTPILIMGYINPENLKVKKLPFSYAVYDLELLKAIGKYQPHAGIHIFVDTGMHREGINVTELPEFLAYIKSFKAIHVEGLMSHFGESENTENILTKVQLDNFSKAIKMVNDAGFYPKWVHIGNSSAILNAASYKGKIGNLTRGGLAIYGIDPEGKDRELQPVLQFTSSINQIKKLQKNEKIGYSFTFTAKKDMTIGILPVGYHDGVDRRLSNRGYVLIENIFCPIVGKVSMNLTTVDLSGLSNAHVGQKVIVYSKNAHDKNSIPNSALVCDTISYDLLVHLAQSTKRVIL